MISNQKTKLILILGLSMFMHSCTTLSKFSSAKTLDITSTITQKPTLADLDVKENKVSGTHSSKNPYDFEVVKQQAVANALKTVNADILVEPKFESTVSMTDISITVTGYPAFYKNFRPLKIEDAVLLQSLLYRKDALLPDGVTPVRTNTVVNPIK